MGVSVYIPTPFRRATANQDRVELEAADVKALLDALEGRFEGLRGLVRNESGRGASPRQRLRQRRRDQRAAGPGDGSAPATRCRSSRPSPAAVPAVILTAAELEAIRRQAEAEYPAECCGVVLARPGPGERRLLACRNIQDELHGRDPGRLPRAARTAYYMAHEDLIEISRQEAAGFGST